jgi:hypothetical protein
MSQNTKRIIHCSFCGDEGHTISNCQDPRIDIVVRDFDESIALDIKCNLKQKYTKHILNSTYNIADIRILGYQKGLTMNKTSKDEFINEISDEYYDIKNSKYNEIFDSFNETELLDFAKDISKSSKQWNSRKLSLPKVKELLGINTHETKPTKYKTISSFETHDDSSDDNEEINDYYNFQYFLLPLADDNALNEISPELKKGLEYVYFLSIGAIALNLYIVYTTW